MGSKLKNKPTRGRGRPRQSRRRTGFRALAYRRMKELGWNYQQLADESGLSVGMANGLLNNRNPTTFNNVVRISKALQINLNEALEKAGMGWVNEGRLPTDAEMTRRKLYYGLPVAGEAQSVG